MMMCLCGMLPRSELPDALCFASASLTPSRQCRGAAGSLSELWYVAADGASHCDRVSCSQALPPAPKLLSVSGPWAGGKQRHELSLGRGGGHDVQRRVVEVERRLDDEWSAKGSCGRQLEGEGCLADAGVARLQAKGPCGRQPAQSTTSAPRSSESYDDERDSHHQMRPEFETLLLSLKGGM